MINSLSKDSHITRTTCLSKSRILLESSVNKNMSKGASVNNSIVTKNPTEISFRGISDIKLANETVFKKLISSAKDFITDSKSADNVKNLITKAVEFAGDTTKTADESIKKFFDANKQDVETLIAKSKELVTADNKKKPLEGDAFDKSVKSTLDSAFKQFDILNKKDGIYNSSGFKNFLKFANDFQIVFGASFALILTCLLRPAAIMALPGEKKNNDDKKYAAAHSIASGTFGFGLALLVSAPISTAIKKVLKDPQLGAYLKKNGSEFLEDSANAKVANTYLNQVPDILLALPKAMITIALMPIVLKYVFGLEKKNSGNNKVSIPVEQSSLAKTPPMSGAKEKNAFAGVAGGVR